MATPSFIAAPVAPGAVDVKHVLTLAVTDNGRKTATTAVTIMAPVANAGPDQTVATKTPVQLDGSASTFDRRETLNYAWMRSGGTQGADVSMTGANTVRLSFVAGTLEFGAPDVEHIFALTGTGSDGMEDADTVRVTVSATVSWPIP